MGKTVNTHGIDGYYMKTEMKTGRVHIKHTKMYYIFLWKSAGPWVSMSISHLSWQLRYYSETNVLDEVDNNNEYIVNSNVQSINVRVIFFKLFMDMSNDWLCFMKWDKWVRCLQYEQPLRAIFLWLKQVRQMLQVILDWSQDWSFLFERYGLNTGGPNW